ncbi:MAG: hypothetical protein WBX15_10190 [Thermoanaerobaculia bacterium]
MDPNVTYPGNPALAPEVKDRVLSTFRQTIDLFRRGSLDDVRAGCQLLMQMDPLFVPAKKLLQATRDPDSVNIEELAAAAVSPALEAELSEAEDALLSRDFARAQRIAAGVLQRDPGNGGAARVAEEAREMMEAEPFVKQFLSNARNHLVNGDSGAALAALEKVKSLDPSHPEIAEIETEAAQGSSGLGADDFSNSSFGFVTPTFGDAADPVPPTPGRSAGEGGGAAASDEKGFGFIPEAQAEHAAEIDVSGSSDSFVVDSQPDPTGTTGAPAAEFGFSFEEDHQPAAPSASSVDAAANGFSFEDAAPEEPAAPKAPAAPLDMIGEAHTFDFTMAAVETSPEDQAKIRTYLEEGDKAFEKGELLDAIDVWSKIFLIDVTNEDASARIEKARGRRLEQESKVDALLSEGIRAFDGHDPNGAKQIFQQVIDLDSTNPTALDYLEKIQQSGGAIPPVTTPPSPAASDALFADIRAGEDEAIASEFASAPPPPRSAARQRPSPAPAAPGGKKLPMPLLAGVGVVILLLAGWFGYQKFATPGGDPTAAQTESMFAKARTMASQGDFDGAIRLLSGVAPDNANHDRALEMIADFKNKKEAASSTIGGRPADQVFRELVEQGKTAYRSRDFLAAKEAFEKANAIRALSASDQQLFQDASGRVSKLDSARALFKEGNYEGAILNLETLKKQDPDNATIDRLITDAHYNLGVKALQDERLPDAITEFGSVLEANPNDQTARRSRDLATRYDGQPRDLLYKIYVKYLPIR